MNTTEARLALTGVTRLALEDLQRLMARLDGASADVVRDALLEVLPELAATWGEAAASVAAEVYEAQRSASGVAGAFVASLAAADEDQAAVLARWGVGSLYSASPDFAAMRSAVSGGFQRLIADAYRDTTILNVEKDPKAKGWARHASANACAFCALLATQGAVYKSKATASRTTGGQKYHDHCHCLPVPVYDGQTYEPPGYVRDWMQAYLDSPTPGLKGTLADMRQALGKS